MIQGFLDIERQPAVVKKFKIGEQRDDGSRYAGMNKRRSGELHPLWLSPSAWEKRKKYLSDYAKKYLKTDKRKSTNKRCQQAWRKKNQEKRRIKDATWREKNRHRTRASATAWQKRNRDKVASASARRRQRIRRHRESAERLLMIEVIYAARQRITKCTGIQFHVDHIHPISKGGMHTPSNLQLLPAVLNMRKNARFSPLPPASHLS
jgi:hypothetical protein